MSDWAIQYDKCCNHGFDSKSNNNEPELDDHVYRQYTTTDYDGSIFNYAKSVLNLSPSKQFTIDGIFHNINSVDSNIDVTIAVNWNVGADLNSHDTMELDVNVSRGGRVSSDWVKCIPTSHLL